VIQKKMKLDGPFGPPEFGPIKDSQAQIDGGRIHGDQFVFESKCFLPHDLDTASFKELKKNLLIELPWTVFIGIGQGGMARSCDAKCFNFPSQLRRPPLISRREWARPNWQNNMATNWPQQLNPLA